MRYTGTEDRDGTGAPLADAVRARARSSEPGMAFTVRLIMMEAGQDIVVMNKSDAV